MDSSRADRFAGFIMLYPQSEPDRGRIQLGETGAELAAVTCETEQGEPLIQRRATPGSPFTAAVAKMRLQ